MSRGTLTGLALAALVSGTAFGPAMISPFDRAHAQPTDQKLTGKEALAAIVGNTLENDESTSFINQDGSMRQRTKDSKQIELLKWKFAGGQFCMIVVVEKSTLDECFDIVVVGTTATITGTGGANPEILKVLPGNVRNL